VAGPVWLTSLFAVVMITVAVYCTGRLVVARWWRRPTELDTDGSHVVMGVAMAGMLVARLRVLPPAAWEAVFAAGAVWFGWRLLHARRGAPPSPWRCLHPVPHIVECAAMVYMFGVLPVALAERPAPGGMAGLSASSAASRFSLLALVLALFMLGYVVRLGDRLSSRAPALAFPLAVRRAPIPGAVAGTAAGVGPSTGAAAEPEAHAPPSGRAGTGTGKGTGTGPGAGSRTPRLAPRCAALCQVAMGITMGYMLIMLL
jgi:hypothetical protein